MNTQVHIHIHMLTSPFMQCDTHNWLVTAAAIYVILRAIAVYVNSSKLLLTT